MGSDVLKTNRWFLLFGLTLGVLFAFSVLSSKPILAATGINQEINFQGRLLNSQGATVPDGYYNIEFKIYQDGDGQSVGDSTGSPSGSLKWTEDYLNDNSQGVEVVNGYLSVELGSINPFGSSIDWNQSTLWLSMNIGNTSASCTPFSSCSPDGEMVPMQPLTSAVYALNANELGGVTASAFGQLASNQTWTGTNLVQPTTNITGLEVQQTSAGSPTADIFDVQGTGGSADNFIQVTSTAANQGSVNITSLGSTNSVSLTSGATKLVINNTASAFTGNVTTSGTINGQTISSAASFTGTLNVATGYQIAGAATTGNYLRGNGTNFVSSAIQVGDLPSLTGTYLRNVPAATTDNTVAPLVGGVVGLTVNGTSGGAATAVNIIQGGAAADLTASNTASTSGNLVSLTQSTSAYTGTAVLLNLAAGSGSFSGNFLDLQKNGTSEFKVDNAGNVTEAGTLQGTSLDGTTGINTGATGGTQRIDSSGNLVNIGTVATSGGINGQTISSAANFSGTLNVATGYQIAGAATTGNYLRGNGTNFVSSAILAGDLPSLQGTYISNVPTSTANNTIAPTATTVVGLTVNGTSGATAATAVNIVQGYAASNLSLSNTGATSSNLVSLTQSTSALTGDGILLNLASGSGSFSGNFLDLQKNGTSEFKVDNAGNVTNLGTINSQTISASANFTGTLAVASTVTGGTYNSQTISSAASFTGTVNVATGYQIAGAATTGNYLRGNGTNFVSSAIQVGDLPSLTGTYLRNVPAATTDNTVAPLVGGVVGLTVNGTSGGAATAVNIIQGGAAADLTASNTASTSGNLVSLTQSTSAYTGTAVLLNLAAGSGSFSGNFLDLQKNGTSEFKVDNAGNVTEAGTLQGTSLDGTTGINTGATGGTQRIDSSGNLVNIGTVATSGGINGQTISSAANFSGTLNVATGYQIAGAATTGNYLRGNGTNFVSSAILAGDLPSLQGTYISNVPTSTANNTIAPTATTVVGLTVNGTSGATAATAVNIVQGYAASNLSLSNTGATSSNLVSLTQSTSALTGDGILLNLASGSGSFSGNFLDLQKNGTSEFKVDNAGNVTNLGTINSQTISASANFTGTLAVASTVTGGTYNSQTISSAASFTGTVNVATGYQIAGAATTGNYLRGNGTNFVSSAIQVGDLPSLTGTYLRNVPAATTDNTVAPLVGGVVGLTVNGTSGGAATAVNIIQGGAAADLTASNTASTSGNLVSLTQSTSAYTGTAVLLNLAAGSGSFSGNFLDLQKNGTSEFKVDNAGNVTEAGTLQGTSLDGTTGINTGATGGTQRIDSSGNLVNIGTVATSGGINGQTISSAANFSGTLNVATGYQIAGAATTGNYLRGNGTNFVSSAILAGDLPSLQGTYISNVPTSTANNTIAPTATTVVGLTVNGTSGATAATAVNIVQGYAASNLSLSNTGATSSNLVSLTQSTSALTGDGILLNLASGSGSFSGNFLDLQKNGTSEFKVDNAGNVTNLGTINSQTISASANFTGTLAVASTVTGGTYNSQTISSAASFTGTVNVATGYQIAGAATTGNYLRGNGTNFVSSAIQVGDLPSLTGTYLRNVPAATTDNTVAPLVGGVVGLTVNGTSGGAATAVNIIQGGAAADLTASNTASTSGNLVSLTQSTSAYTGTAVLLNLAAGSGSFSGNFLDLQKNGTSEFKVDNAGNVTEAGTLQGTSLDGTTGINTGATGGTQRIDSSGNLVNIGTVATSGGINGQTISSAANFSGTLNVATGYQIAGAATTGNYLRGNGTNFVSSAILAGDLPSLQGTYISNVPTSTANNTIAPTAASVVGLTVTGTTGTAATALNILQGGAAAGIGVTSSTTGDGEDVSLTNTTGIQTNGIYVNRNGSGGTTTNLLNLTNTLGTATNAITLSGTFVNDLINSTNFSVTNGGSLSAVGVNAGSGSLQGAGGLSLTGTANINTSGSAATSIGNSGSTVTIASSGVNVTALGAVSGVTTLSTSSTINGQTISNAASFTGTLAVTSSITGGTYNTDTLNSTALTFSGAAPVISASTSNTGLTLQANGSGTLLLDTTGAGIVNLGLTATGINLGTSTGVADTIGIGSSNTSTAITLQGGSSKLVINNTASAFTGSITSAGLTTLNGGLTVNTATASDVLITSGSSVPSSDQVDITNTGSSGVTTAGVNGLDINYKGGAAAVEAGAEEIDLQPSTTSGSTWDGYLYVANSTGPATGVTENGFKAEGPTTGGAGTFSDVDIANVGAVTTGGTVNGINIIGTNSNAAGTENGINIATLTGGAATENALNIGTGWDYILQNTNFNITGAGAVTGGTYNTDTLNSTALTFSGAAPVISASTSNTGLTLQANGSGTLLLDTTGAGIVNLGLTATGINLGTSTGVADTIGIGSSNTSTAITLQGGSSKLVINNTASAFTGNVTINSGTSGNAGLQLTQIAASAGCSGYCDLLGINTSGQVGLSNAAVSLTSPALAYWDGLNDPTTSDQSYPTNPIATYTCTGSCTGAGGTGGFNSGNGELLNPAQQNTYGSLNWSFAQVQFEEIQFQLDTTPCSLNCAGLTSGADASWFYGYASGTPTTEFGCDVAVGSCNGTNNISDGYIIYFSEYHDCIGIAYAYYADGNQCNNGGGTSGAGTSPLASVAMPAGAINDANWHDVDIQILDNKIYVRWDGQLVLSYTDVYNRDLTDYQDFGFGSRSGGNVDNHYVKGLLVTKLGSNASQYNVDSASPLASNLYWNNGSSNLGVDTSSPNSNLEVDGTTALEPTVAGVYNTGTACQSNSGTSCASTAGTLVFGTGTTWSSNVAAGDTITFSNGETGRITTVNSNTELTVSSSQLIPSGSTYSINQGTACQSSSTTSCGTSAGTAIFGTNTDFTSSMVGDIINWPDGATGVITGYTSATKLTVSGTSQLQAGSTYTIEAGGLKVSNVTTSTVANVTIGANSTIGGTIINDTETATGTHTYNTAGVEQNAAYGYNFYTNLSSTTATTDTFNITGLPSTEGTTAFIESELTAAGTNTQSITVNINGTTMSTISKTTAGTYYDDYIVMYSGSAWRIIGQGALTGQTLPTGYTQGIDYAEWIPYSGDSQPQPGDVLTVGSSNSSVTDSSTLYDPALLGVVSTQPYEVAGSDDGHSVIIALTGRVPVNVSLANGPIEAGDPLTSSSIPGVAMKATEPGNIIGTALESYDGTQTSNQIMVQLHVGFDDPTAGSGQLQGDQSINGDLAVSGNTALQGSMSINGGISVAGNSTMNSLMVGNTLNVDGNLSVSGTATINDLESQSANISGQFSAGNSTLASLLIANDLTVNGNITVNGTATVSNLNVSGSTSTQNLAVSGTTLLAGDIQLTGNVNTRQAIIKTFTASGPIAAGNAVIIDNTPGNEGDVTTTTTPDDPRVIGVAVTAAAGTGDTVQVAIGGWVQVQVNTSPVVNGNPPPPITPGQLIVTSGTAGTIQESANPAAGSILGKSTSNQDPNNLVWILITLQ